MKIILFELNEVPPRIFAAFCAANPASTLAKLRSCSTQATTIAQDDIALLPWITWATLHRGVTFEKHGIAHLGQSTDGANGAYPSLWDLVAANGGKVGVCGSLNSYPPPADKTNYSFYLPDTFAPDSQAFPPALEAFQAFNLSMVGQSQRNVSTRIDTGGAMKLLPHLRALGFGAATALTIASQLISERHNIARKVRRRTLQTVLAFDTFMAQLVTAKPDFVTFFTNHVGSAMHRFWGAKYPGDFDRLDYDQVWIDTFGGEIDACMLEADRMAARLKAFVDANPDYTLLIASSMGQAAYEGDAIFTELFVTDMPRFLTVLGLPSDIWRQSPSMHPDYSIHVSEDHADVFERALKYAAIGRRRVAIEYDRRANGFFHLHMHFKNLDAEQDLLHLGNESMPLAAAGLEVIETDFQQGVTGHHIPEGIMLAYGAQIRPKTLGEISTCDIAPTVLAMLGMSRQSYMRAPLAL